MASKTFVTRIHTDQAVVAVQDATIATLRTLGGSIQQNGIGFELTQASQGVTFAFIANFTTLVTIRSLHRDTYEVECIVQWSPNWLFWLCVILGVFAFGVLWVIPILYFFIDPTDIYQQALYRIQGYFPQNNSGNQHK
jgi:hypothetical protein